MVELLLAVVPVDKLVGNLAVVFEFPLVRCRPLYLAWYFVGFLGCHVPLELLSTGCITPGESVPSTFSIGAGLFELQAVKIAILTGSNKKRFFHLFFL